ncbi:MAG: HAD family acid phosphatase [Planctomycetota bacterium]
MIIAPRLNALVLAALLTSVIAGGLSAQDVDLRADDRFGALAWIQNSAEYRLLTEQTYRAAMTQLLVGLHDPNWSADEVQLSNGGFQSKQPAVILDCDETVLDNSAYNARNIVEGKPYSTDSWNAWCQEGQAGAVPGSLEFVTAASGLGVSVFFVTNRRDVVKQATIKNLNDLGFSANEENVLTKNEEMGRAGDKVSRRAMVAADHRIVLMIGDNMGDLCSGMDTLDSDERNRIAKEKRALLGSRWIMLPNPVYGGWQRALPSGQDALILSR